MPGIRWFNLRILSTKSRDFRVSITMAINALQFPGGQPGDTQGVAATLDRLLTAKEVAAYVGVNVKRVYELGIPAVHISARSLRWRQIDVQRWIDERRDPT
jgi:predicted DNA-binding transcriptional regulator AlpA